MFDSYHTIEKNTEIHSCIQQNVQVGIVKGRDIYRCWTLYKGTKIAVAIPAMLISSHKKISNSLLWVIYSVILNFP